MAKRSLSALPPVPFAGFLTSAEVTQYVQSLAAARPGYCRLESLGPSREGRPLHLLVLSDLRTGRAEDRPAYLIHANIHAVEVAGTHLALHTARQLLSTDLALLGEVTFYIVPRLNPDGAEYAVGTGGSVRSRLDCSERTANALYPQDVNGDGRVLTMRQVHPDGPFACDARESRLMVRRRAGMAGPFYRLLPEGLIHAWDGSDQVRLGGRSLDWNRNWSYDWRPEPEQPGAGDFPFSEPEMHHLARFLHERSNLFGVLGYHTGPGAVLRPPSTGSDADLPEADVRLLEDLARSGARATGLPVYPVIKYHYTWQRDINLRGHFHNFGYHHLGLHVFEFELGTARDSAGLDAGRQLGVLSDEEAEAQMRELFRWWDGPGRRHPLFCPWQPYCHPQLGEVEIGGFLSCGLANQTLARLRSLARGTHAFTLEHVRRRPRVAVEEVQADDLGSQVWRVRARVANRGELPTHVTARGAGLRRLRPVTVEFHPRGELLSRQAHHELGHLTGLTGSRCLEWFVRQPPGDADLGEVRVQGGAGGNLTVKVRAPA